jgi:nitrate reductase assembly molybdenum cofactor insertion protein NarJ
MKKIALDVQVRELVAQAAAWRFASLLLERPRPEWKNEIGAVRSEVTDEELSSCAEKAEQGTEEDYHRLFGPGGEVSPREVSYCGFEDPGHLMAELQSFYQAFSYLPRREESIDHVSVEAGFVGYLFLKEAYARTQENPEAARITKSARSRFMKEHVSRCATGVRTRLTENPAYLRKVFSWLVKRGETGL